MVKKIKSSDYILSKDSAVRQIPLTNAKILTNLKAGSVVKCLAFNPDRVFNLCAFGYVEGYILTANLENVSSLKEVNVEDKSEHTEAEDAI